MTKYIKESEMTKEDISEVGAAIREGKIVVLKTDTVYGMVTDAKNEHACKRIFDIKGRPLNKPLTLLISDVEMLEDLVRNVNLYEKRLIDTFWPGPLTIKFLKKDGVLPGIVSAGDQYVRVRLLCPGLAKEIIEEAGVAVVAPSANLSGSLTGVKISRVIQELFKKVDYIIDSGDIDSDVTSTIVQVIEDEVLIIREGRIKREEIEKVVPLRIEA